MSTSTNRKTKDSPFSDSEIFSYRKSKGLSREELAIQLGVNSATIYRWESGRTKPSQLALSNIKKLELNEELDTTSDNNSTPRLRLRIGINGKKSDIAKHLENTTQLRLLFDGVSTIAIPTSWVRNGPEDQAAFHQLLIDMQLTGLTKLKKQHLARRFSLVQEIDGVGKTAQYELETPKPIAMSWNSNYGSHGWHRYVGRFPPHVIRSLLNHFGATKDDVVCDPFSGSGTTAVECRLLGIPFIGIEICPLSCLMSRTKAGFPVDPSTLENISKEFSSFYAREWAAFLDKRNIADCSHNNIMNRSGNPVPSFTNIEKWFTPQALLGVSIAVQYGLTLTGFERDAFLLAISSRMRSIGNVDVDVVRAEYSKTPRQNVDVSRLVSAQLNKMARDIRAMVSSHRDLLSERDSIKIMEGSVLDIKLKPESIDHIITSPPYGVEAISYLRTHLLSYRSLVGELKHDPYETKDKTIGSEYTTKPNPNYSNKCDAISNSYKEFFGRDLRDQSLAGRKLAMMQFFEDLLATGQKMAKWLKPEGNIAFIMGNKRLGDEIIPADQIIIELFDNIGLRHQRSIKHKLKTNNSNSSVPWQEKVIDEEFIMLFKKAS